MSADDQCLSVGVIVLCTNVVSVSWLRPVTAPLLVFFVLTMDEYAISYICFVEAPPFCR